MKWTINIGERRESIAGAGLTAAHDLASFQIQGAAQFAAMHPLDGRLVRIKETADPEFRLEENHALRSLARSYDAKLGSIAYDCEMYVGRGQTLCYRAQALPDLPGLAERQLADAMGPHSLQSPMTGKIVKVLAEVGATLQADSALLVIEAMKMENVIPAGKAGTLTQITKKPGDSTTQGELLAVIDQGS